jgi:hypothetical protein
MFSESGFAVRCLSLAAIGAQQTHQRQCFDAFSRF